MKFIVFLIPIILCGCIYLEYSAKPSEIITFAREKQNEGAVQNLLWYRGREGNFDYYTYVHDMFGQRKFKVTAGAILNPKNFALTDDATQWVAIPSIGNEWNFYVPQH